MSTEANKALVRRVAAEVWNTARPAPATLAELFEAALAEQVRESWARTRRAFPDIRVRVDDQIAEGDQVVTRYTAHATHRGAWQGLAPTGTPLTWAGVNIFRIRAGRIVARWSLWDTQAMRQQLGAGPAPGPPR
jgi:steroid delta-isomerase-like uncharacterized protein